MPPHRSLKQVDHALLPNGGDTHLRRMAFSPIFNLGSQGSVMAAGSNILILLDLSVLINSKENGNIIKMSAGRHYRNAP
jgi:hypothetical protein